MADTPNIRPIDAVTASVIQGALENIAVEMGWKLMRMSYSSIIRESEDFGRPSGHPANGRHHRGAARLVGARR